MHARDSIDGKGLRMFNIVHYSNNYANAFWSGNGTNTMTYGDGDNSTLLNTTRGLDVIAHEMTHGVTEFESGLGYAKGTANGGMNESMSDIFGCLAEHWAQPNAVKNWQIGEDVAGPSLSGGALRFMDSPTKDGRSIDHASKNTSSTDVHLNSGVSNNAFYLMTAGGTNKTSSINVKTGIGWDKAGKVMYQTQTQYLMSSDGWAQFAAANLTAAKNIGLTQNEQNIIQCAWIAVGGLTTPTTCADTTGGDGVDGGTTMDSSTPPPTDGGTTTPDVRTDTPVPPADASADRPTVDTNVPDTPAQPDTVTPPVDAAPDVPTTMPDATGGRGGSSGTGGSGGGGTSGTGGSTGGSGGSTGGSGGSTGGTGGSTGGTAGGGAAGTTGGSTNRGGNGGSAGSGGSGPSDPGCGCTVPGQSAPSTKSTLALAVGLVAAAISRRRRRNAV
jgi:MYXO-CTERM domain-containing protein